MSHQKNQYLVGPVSSAHWLPDATMELHAVNLLPEGSEPGQQHSCELHSAKPFLILSPEANHTHLSGKNMILSGTS